MPTVKIKGEDRPLKIELESALILRDRWQGNDSKGIFKARPSDPVQIKDWSGTYGDIKGIFLKDDSVVYESRPHWIIFSPKRNAIWKQPYLSFAEAKSEYDARMGELGPEEREAQDWKIEIRNHREEKDGNDGFGGL